MRARTGASVLFAIVLCAAASPAAAQSGSKPQAPRSGPPALDISAGYSYVREAGTDGGVPNIYNAGWVVSVSHRIGASRIAVVGEAGGSYRLDVFGERQSLYGFFGGVRVPLVHLFHLSTFAQALVGKEYFSQPGFSESGIAFQPGAGVDLRLVGSIGLRVQGDYRIAHEEGINFQESRIAASLVFGMR